MRTAYAVRPGAEADIERVATKIATKNRRGRYTALPGAEIVEHYGNGRPKTYRYKRRLYTLRQYTRLVRTLRDQGFIGPKRTVRDLSESDLSPSGS